MSELTPASRPLPQLRQQYLKSLEEPQEFFLEELVSTGQFWTNDEGSYGVINGRSLVEFFSPDLKSSTRLLRRLHDQHRFSTALVKSYDCNFMGSCQELGWKGAVGGFLFRKRKNPTYTVFRNAVLSAAVRTDVEPLWEINDDFFESDCQYA